MKVVLYMAITVNGYIASEEDDTDWVSEEDFQGQERVASEAGNIVYGRRTYEMGLEENCLPVPGCLNVVMTSRAGGMERKEGFLFTGASPKEIVEMLSEKGFDRVIVAGGSVLNASFMREGLIGEIYLDVEPVVLGKGKPLFSPEDLRFDLRLIGVKKLSGKTVQLHYEVVDKMFGGGVRERF